jgi:hypothetical protein
MFTRLGEGAVVDSQDNGPKEQQKEGSNGRGVEDCEYGL